MYEIEYNREVKKYGVYRSSPFLSNKLLCGVYDTLEEAISFIVSTIKKSSNDDKFFLL